MNKQNDSFKLQPSLKRAAEKIAHDEGTSLNQFVNLAVAEKLSALETETYFARRARLASREHFLKFLDRAGDEPSVEGDEMAG